MQSGVVPEREPDNAWGFYRFYLSLARGLHYYTGLTYEAVLVAGPESSHENVRSIAARGRLFTFCSVALQPTCLHLHQCMPYSVCCQALLQEVISTSAWQASAAGCGSPLVNRCSTGMGMDSPWEVLVCKCCTAYSLLGIYSSLAKIR